MKRSYTILIIFFIIIGLTSCKTENMTKSSASMDAVESAIKAQIKSDLISSGKYKETDFAGSDLPGYQVSRYSDKNFSLPFSVKSDKLKDAVVVTNLSQNNADTIVVMKAISADAASSAEAYAAKLREEQAKVRDMYLPDQMDKLEKTNIKTAGNYVIYIVYDDTTKMEQAIMKVIR